jgi:hypothetical protein
MGVSIRELEGLVDLWLTLFIGSSRMCGGNMSSSSALLTGGAVPSASG